MAQPHQNIWSSDGPDIGRNFTWRECRNIIHKLSCKNAVISQDPPPMPALASMRVSAGTTGSKSIFNLHLTNYATKVFWLFETLQTDIKSRTLCSCWNSPRMVRGTIQNNFKICCRNFLKVLKSCYSISKIAALEQCYKMWVLLFYSNYYNRLWIKNHSWLLTVNSTRILLTKFSIKICLQKSNFEYETVLVIRSQKYFGPTVLAKPILRKEGSQAGERQEKRIIALSLLTAYLHIIPLESNINQLQVW